MSARIFSPTKTAMQSGKAKTGHIVIQDHGSVFWFRNVRIRTSVADLRAMKDTKEDLDS